MNRRKPLTRPRPLRCLTTCLLAAAAICAGPAHAQVDSARVAELERRIRILAEELERMRSGEETEMTAEEARVLGLSPSAAAAYSRTSGASFAGYGEMLYENWAGRN